MRSPYPIKALKTANYSAFTNYYLGTGKRSDMTVKTLYALDQWYATQGTTRRLIDPGKRAQNGTMEWSHRENEEKFYQQHDFASIRQLKKKLRLWNEYYNDLEHCPLDRKIPNEVLHS